MSFSRFCVTLDQAGEQQGEEWAAAHPSLALLTTRHSHRIPPARTEDSIPEDHQKTAILLRTLTAEIFDNVINTKNFAHPTLTRHLASEYETNNEWSDEPGHEQLKITARDVKLMPNLHATILNSEAKVHDSGCKAEVWTLVRINGLPGDDSKIRRGETMKEDDGIVKECVSVLRWEKREKLWMCVSFKVLICVSGL